MANQGMLRGSGLRASRESIDTGTGEKRMGGTIRESHLGRGTFMNFYEDLGISATKEGAEAIRADEARFSEGVQGQQGIINKNQKANERNKVLLGQSTANVAEIKKGQTAAQKALDSYKGVKVPNWNQYRANEYSRGYGSGDYKLVQLYNRGGKKLHGEWYLPTATANKLANHTDAYWGGAEGSRGVKIIMKHQSQLQPVADQLQSGSNMVSNAIGNAYITVKGQAAVTDRENMKTLSSNISAYGSALTAAQEERGTINKGVSSLRGLINTQKMTLKGNKADRAAQWDAIHEKREDKLSNMEDFFSSLNLGV